MTAETLSLLRDRLVSLGIKDVTQSLLARNTELEIGTGLMKVLSYVPEDLAIEILEFTLELSNNYTVENYYALLQTHDLLTFKPYILNTEQYGKVIVCAVNMFVVFDHGYIKVVTDLDKDSVLSCSVQSISCLIEILKSAISTDVYNAIVATLLCTTFMCKSLRDSIRDGDTVVTEFLSYIIRDCKAQQVYSIETFKSKLSWVNLAQKSNFNYAITSSNKLLYNLSIGTEATTLEYATTVGCIGHVTFLYDQNKLSAYDSLFKIKSSYFAYALYLLASDIFTSDFLVIPKTEVKYTVVDDISKIYFS